jgi:hypothetical protein
MHEDDFAKANKYKIRAAGQILPVQPKAVAQSVSHFANRNLWRGI